MSTNQYSPTNPRHIAVLRAIDGGATLTTEIHAALPQYLPKSIRNSLVSLRQRELIESEREAEGYTKRYRLRVKLAAAIEELTPEAHPIEIGELEQAMGIPPEVRATLATVGARVVMGRAGLNSTEAKNA